MIGLELADNIPACAGSDKPAAVQFVRALHQAGLLAIPAGANVIRLLPALNLPHAEAAEGARLIESVVRQLSL
jgi:acetylornithine/succinyldiaminopimelate/putrescine aminotransferase